MPADAVPSSGVDSVEATGGPVQLLRPEDLAKKYAVHKQTILAWFHTGIIPAEVAMGKVYRFDEKRVERALAAQRKREPKERRDGRLSEFVQVI